MDIVTVNISFEKSHFDESDIIDPVMPVVSIVENMVRLTFKTESDDDTVASANLSTAIRSSSHYDYSISDVTKIPHDMVHSTLSSIPEGTVVADQTPDIVWYDESGACNVIEVATRNVYTFEDAKSAVDEKLATYGWQLPLNSISKFNVIVVYHNGVIALGGTLSRGSIEKLIKAYKIGFRILEMVSESTGMSFSPYSEDSLKYSNMIKSLSIKPVESTGRESQCIITEDDESIFKKISSKHTLVIGTDDYVAEKNNGIRDWLHNLPGDLVDGDTVVHLPLIEMCEDEIAYKSCPEYQNILHLMTNSNNPERDLEKWRRVSLKDRKEIRVLEKSKQSDMVNLSIEERISLSKRGLFKKSLMHMDIVKEFDDSQSRTYSYLCDTRDIHGFVNEPIVESSNDLISISDLEEFHISDKTGFDPHDFVDMLLNTDLFKSITILDKVVREVILNMKNNPKDNKQKSRFEFYYRDITEDLSMIFKTTKYSSDSPIFFLITSFRPFKPISGIFESVYKTGNYYHTKFMSLSNTRAEHLCNILSQCISLAALIVDEMSNGLYNSSLDSLNSVLPQFKTLLLILLEDKEYTSRNLQQMRYYYMEALSNGFEHSGKISSKLDPFCRSRLFLYCMKRTADFHDINVENMAKFRVDENEISDHLTDLSNEEADDYDDDPASSSMFFKRLEAREDKLHIFCYLGYEHRTLQTLMIPMYSCVLHNKNEMEKMVSAKKLTNKIIKEELKLPHSRYCKGDLSHKVDSSKYRSHDWSARVVKRASEFLRDELTQMCSDKLLLHVTKEMMKTELDDLSSTKSSHSGIYMGQINSHHDLDRLGNRSKCILEVYNREWDSQRLISNLPRMIKHMETVNDNRVQVQLFRKNQIGGTREIYILDFMSRCLIRVLEDMSRALCKIHPYEMLTKPHLKESLIGNHFHEVRKQSGTVVTIRMSLDKTTWAQQFVNPMFYVMLSTIIPEYSSLIKYILNCHTRKVLELPPELIKSFLSDKPHNLSDYEVNYLREEFLGNSKPFLMESSGRAYMYNVSNMMQGILHYTSSLLHTSMLVYIKHRIKLIEAQFNKINPNQEIALVYTPQTSSDDSGILVSIIMKSDTPDKSIPTRIMRGLQSMMRTVDSCFCVRTSIEKSSVTFNSKYEFNSTFFSENNLAVPLIKFVSRCSDDNPSESLKSRVSNLYNSLRDVRANGGSGALCSVCSVSQKLAMFQNLGYTHMRFFEKYVGNLRTYKLSHFGVYTSHPPLIAGLYGTEISDYYNSCQDPYTKHMLTVLHRNPTIGGHLLSEFSTTYRAWPMKRYKRLLSDLNIIPDYKSSLTFSDLEFFFRPSLSVSDVKDKIKLTLSNSSIARSFSFLTRCQSVMSSAYLLWDNIFTIDGSHEYSMGDLIKEAESLEIDELSLEVLFPNHSDLNLTLLACQSDITTFSNKTRFIFRSHTYSPIFSGLNKMNQIKKTLGRKWFNIRGSISEKAADRTFETLKQMIPWLSSDANETLEKSGLDSPISLLNYIILLCEKVKPISIISMGGSRRDKGMIENIALMNCFRNRITKIFSDPELTIKKETLTGNGTMPIMRLQNRLSDWRSYAQLFHFEDDYQQYLSKLMTEDMTHLINEYFPTLESNMIMGVASHSAMQLCSLVDEAAFSRMKNDNDISMYSHIKMQEKNGNVFTGPGKIYRKYDSSLEVMLSFNGNIVNKILYKGEVLNKARVMKEFSYLDFGCVNWIRVDEILVQAPNCISYHGGQLWACHSINRNYEKMNMSYIYPLKVRSTFNNETFDTSHWKERKALTEAMWMMRIKKEIRIEEIIKRDTSSLKKLIHLSVSAYKNASTSLVRAGYMNADDAIKQRSNLRNVSIDEESFYGASEEDDDFDFEAMMEATSLELFDLAQEMTVEDMYSGMMDEIVVGMLEDEYKAEPDMSLFTEHPLLPILINNIATKAFYGKGLGKIALDAALELNLISSDEAERYTDISDDFMSMM